MLHPGDLPPYLAEAQPSLPVPDEPGPRPQDVAVRSAPAAARALAASTRPAVK